MSDLREAKKVLRILKQKGYEAYLVGGVVRDYLLQMPMSDIDITTNATPFQVSKIFKTVPTGIKYGTVTAEFNQQTFEITTYRKDSQYADHRHPEVEYTSSVIEDVQRRDFTMNGLLMDDSSKIFDHVDGMSDIKNKMIRAIGNPVERFEEDAIRMLRAFYFQSKLGFQIEKETRNAIELNRNLIKEIAMERVLDEVIKIFKGPFLKKALKSMVQTHIDDVLPGLKEGIRFFESQEEMPFVDAFFATSFVLNRGIPKEWVFSNKHRHKYQQVIEIVNHHDPKDPVTLYTYGVDICLLANKVKFLLKQGTYDRKYILEAFENLPVKSEFDLKIRPQQMMQITQKKAGAWIAQVQKKMIEAILRSKLKNEPKQLEAFVLEFVSKKE